jgi:hypothetical protein
MLYSPRFSGAFQINVISNVVKKPITVVVAFTLSVTAFSGLMSS